jgi:hypothetical protein
MDAADSLYETAPAEFVKARNALVKSLKAQGQRDEADRISRMVRPTASVWATNQVARRAADLIERLADVTNRLQGGVQRDRDRYAAAINEHRELLNQLRARVEELLAGAGLRGAPPVIAAAVQNFRAGLMDDAIRPLLLRGRLEHDVPLDAGGALFGMSALDLGAPPPPPPAARHPHGARDHAGGRKHEDEQARERERREQARALARARADAERRVHGLRKTAESAAHARAKRESEVDHARRQLAGAEHALAAAQSAEREALAAVDAAEAELKKLPAEPA